MAWELTTPQVSKNKTETEAASIVIGVPHRDNFSSTWIMGLLRTLQNDYQFEVVMDGGSRPIDVSRNVMVAQTLRWNFDYIFMMDSDIILDRDAIPKLLKVDKPIVSGLYRGRAPPNYPVADIAGKKIDEKLMGEPITMSVDHVGMGCCLISTEVLKKMGENYTWLCLIDHTKEVGRVVATFTYAEAQANEFLCPHCKNLLLAPYFQWLHGFTTEDSAGSEDYVFCKRVRDAGFEIYVRCDVTPAHETKVLIAKEGITTLLKGSDGVG